MKLLRLTIRELLLESYSKLKRDNPSEELFKLVRSAKLYGDPMPEVDFNEIAKNLNKEKSYETPMNAFEPAIYTTFDDWFLRKLTPETLEACKKKGVLNTVVSPCQGTVRQEVPSGNITLKRSILHLDELLGILGSESLVQISLRKTDYHRVHAPCNGVVTEIQRYEQHELFKESEACTIIKIDCDDGPITLMLIGEWTVQTFVTDLREGDRIEKLEEIGYFYFGSQIILGFDGPLKLVVKPNDRTRVFPGDPLFE